MTTFTKAYAKKLAKRVLFISGLLLISSNCLHAQLNSAEVVSISFSQEIETGSSGVDTLDVMNVQVEVNDFDLVGEMIVTVYSANSNYPLYRAKYTRQEAIDAGIVTDDTAEISLYNVSPSGSFRVETQVTNHQGANLPKILTDYN